MKYLSVVVFVSSTALALAGISDDEMALFKQMSATCVQQSGVPKELVMKAKEGVFESDPKLSEYLFCMLKTPGFMDGAGDYQIGVMKFILGQKFGGDLASKVVDECTAFQGNKLEKALHLAKCFYSNKPAK